MINKIFKNKLAFYLLTRYFTYFVQFLTSLLIAKKLGPENYGVWGVLLLIITYFALFNFGLSNSINVILVQKRNDKAAQSNYILNDFFLIGLLSLVIVIICVVYILTGMNWFKAFSIKYEFIILCVVAVLAHYNLNLLVISRIYNDYNRIAFNQSVIPLFMLISVIIFDGQALLYALIGAYLMGNVLSVLVYLINKPFVIRGKVSLNACLSIIKKGWWLFLYNLCFYMILISTRTIISGNYSIEDFGFFTFSFTLGDSVLLLFQAVANIAFPKILSKFSQKDIEIKPTIEFLNDTYITLVYFSVLLVSVAFPIILIFFPRYESCANCMTLVAITMAIYTRSFPYSSYLMANNCEKILFCFSLVSLCINVIGAFILIRLNITYEYIILSTMISYYIFFILCVQYSNRINEKERFQIFDWRFGLPIFVIILIMIFGYKFLYILPIILFFIFNITRFSKIKKLSIKLITNYKIINL